MKPSIFNHCIVHIHASTAPVLVSGETLDLAALITAQDRGKERFELSSDGTMITDYSTGLMWEAQEHEFANAKAAEVHARDLRLGGHSDWMVPDVDTLQTILDRTLRAPACHPIFKSHGECVITSTPYKTNKDKPAGSSGYVWFVGFYDGYVSYPHRGGRCWCRAVRRVSPAGQ